MINLGGLSGKTSHMGFVGCISEVAINRKKLKISPYHQMGSTVGISTCVTCDGNLCDNGGICQVYMWNLFYAPFKVDDYPAYFSTIKSNSVKVRNLPLLIRTS